MNSGVPSLSFWEGQRVWVSGHTGFKGSWLVEWLLKMGATVSGFALAPEHPDCPYLMLRHRERIAHDHHADVRDPAAVKSSIEEARPSIIFHLAAQPLVRTSYQDPVGTFATNVQGTVNVLEAARKMPGLLAAVVVTTDKVYANREWTWGYRENDRLGGHDPYAASKAASELVADSYRASFFDRPTRVPTVRAGNVIGGGDWSRDRLLPDCIRAFKAGIPVTIRRPGAVRPWQHVVEPLRGYLLVAEHAAEDTLPSACWNFGPQLDDCRPVSDVVTMASGYWGEGASWLDGSAASDGLHETNILALDATQARLIGWRPRLDLEAAVRLTTDWYLADHSGCGSEQMMELTHRQIGLASEGAVDAGE